MLLLHSLHSGTIERYMVLLGLQPLELTLTNPNRKQAFRCKRRVGLMVEKEKIIASKERKRSTNYDYDYEIWTCAVVTLICM